MEIAGDITVAWLTALGNVGNSGAGVIAQKALEILSDEKRVSEFCMLVYKTTRA